MQPISLLFHVIEAPARKPMRSLRLLVVTGFGLFHDKSEFPCVDVLTSKPIRIPALREAIATALDAA